MIPLVILIILILLLYIWSYFFDATYLVLILSILTFMWGGIGLFHFLEEAVLYEYFTQKSIDIIEKVVAFGCFVLPMVRYEGHWIFLSNSMRIIYQIEKYISGISDHKLLNQAVKKILLEHKHLFKEYNAFFFTKKGIKKYSLLFMKSFKFKALVNPDTLLKYDELKDSENMKTLTAYCDDLYQKISEI